MTVYVTQEPQARGGRPTMDLSPAQEYGEMVFLLPPGPVALSPAPMVRDLRRALAGFTSEDYLLALGDPVAIGIATSVASDMSGGLVRMLRWDRRDHRYVEIKTNTKGGSFDGL